MQCLFYYKTHTQLRIQLTKLCLSEVFNLYYLYYKDVIRSKILAVCFLYPANIRINLAPK